MKRIIPFLLVAGLLPRKCTCRNTRAKCCLTAWFWI